jgi:biopolymer transport protein ExbD
MRVPRRERQSGARFNITPLIDVVFLLVIFFLVATHFAHQEEVEAVELPTAGNVAGGPEVPRRLTVTVRADGTMSVKGRVVDALEVEHLILADTTERSADYEVRIRADQQAPYERVEPILLACLRAGVTKIGFAVTER